MEYGSTKTPDRFADDGTPYCPDGCDDVPMVLRDDVWVCPKTVETTDALMQAARFSVRYLLGYPGY